MKHIYTQPSSHKFMASQGFNRLPTELFPKILSYYVLAHYCLFQEKVQQIIGALAQCDAVGSHIELCVNKERWVDFLSYLDLFLKERKGRLSLLVLSDLRTRLKEHIRDNIQIRMVFTETSTYLVKLSRLEEIWEVCGEMTTEEDRTWKQVLERYNDLLVFLQD